LKVNSKFVCERAFLLV